MNSTYTCEGELAAGSYHSYLFTFEKSFNYIEKNKWLQNNWTLALVFIANYLILIQLGQWFMKSRKPYNLRAVLFLWNISLAILSIAACIRLLPEIVHRVTSSGWGDLVCNLGYVEEKQAIAVWVWYFVWSKVVELGDTAFIVLRKQPLIFLHWYHHITVLLYVWYTTAYLSAMCFPFMTLNYVVHGFMYSYYALKSLRIKIPRSVSMMLTLLQLFQMVVGVTITGYAYVVKARGKTCCCSDEAIVAAMIMYGSYFLLFLKFFIQAYIGKKKMAKKID